MKKLSYFLYRRLARWITCGIRLADYGVIPLDSKYQLASFQDVFCSPFYWQLSVILKRPARTVVDLGAHLGHFTIFISYLQKELFRCSPEHIYLFEANSDLISRLKKNIANHIKSSKLQIFSNAVGQRAGSVRLMVNPSNLLQTTINLNAKGKSVDYVDLDKILGTQTIDVCKCDIEGSEFDFIQTYGEILKRTRIFLVEIHTFDEKQIIPFDELLEEYGLIPVGRSICTGGNIQKIYVNDSLR
ncbi:MAG: FkbM family methyltransferase [Verrucomicrobiota bacterium]|nr:FkbM family methyltransferase [Verrucomicrobiota bacterium]